MTGKRFGVCLSSALCPTHRIAPSTPLPIARLSTPLVMTMLQTAVLSLDALLESRYHSAKKKKNGVPRGGSGVFRRKLTVCVELGSPQAHPSNAQAQTPCPERC